MVWLFPLFPTRGAFRSLVVRMTLISPPWRWRMPSLFASPDLAAWAPQFLGVMNIPKDILALAFAEFDLSSIEEGKYDTSSRRHSYEHMRVLPVSLNFSLSLSLSLCLWYGSICLCLMPYAPGVYVLGARASASRALAPVLACLLLLVHGVGRMCVGVELWCRHEGWGHRFVYCFFVFLFFSRLDMVALGEIRQDDVVSAAERL